MGFFDRVLPDVKGRVVGFVLEYLGQYLDGLDKKQIKLKLWQGDLAIQNVRFKPTAIDDLLQDNLKLPWSLAWGKVRVLNLRVPWSSLKKDSVVISLDGIEVVVMPQKARPCDSQARASRQKEKLLAEWEAQRVTSSHSSKDDSPKQKSSWFRKLKSVILENIRFDFKNVTFRYEDATSNPAAPIALGLKLSSLSMSTATSSWEQTFVNNTVGESYFKILDLRNLSLFVSPNVNIESCCTIPRGLALLAAGQNADLHTVSQRDVVLRPLSCVVRLELQREGKLTNSKPSVKTTINASEVSLELSQQQYSTLLTVVKGIQQGCELNRIIARERPPPFCRPTLGSDATSMRNMGFTANTKAWWLYAFSMVNHQLHPTPFQQPTPQPKTVPKSHENLLSEYISLHTTAISSSGLSEDEQQSYDFLHSKLSLDELIACRNAVYATQSKGQGSKSAKEQPAPVTPMATIDPPVQYPKGSEIWVVNAGLTRCTVKLENGGNTILFGEFTDLNVKISGKPEGLKVATSIDSISLLSSEVVSNDKDCSDRKNEVVSRKTSSKTTIPLFYFEFEQNPVCQPDSSSQLKLNLQPVTLFCDSAFINSLRLFFTSDPNSVAELALVRSLAQDTVSHELEAIRKHLVTLDIELMNPSMIIRPTNNSELSLMTGCDKLSIRDVPTEQLAYTSQRQRIQMSLLGGFVSTTPSPSHDTDILCKGVAKVNALNKFLVNPVSVAVNVVSTCYSSTASEIVARSPDYSWSITVEIKDNVSIDASLADVELLSCTLGYLSSAGSLYVEENVVVDGDVGVKKLEPSSVALNSILIEINTATIRMSHTDNLVSVITTNTTVVNITTTSEFDVAHASLSLDRICMSEENGDVINNFVESAPLTISANLNTPAPRIEISSNNQASIIVGESIVRCVEVLYRSAHCFSKSLQDTRPRTPDSEVASATNSSFTEGDISVSINIARASLTVVANPVEIGSFTLSGSNASLLISSYSNGVIVNLNNIEDLAITDDLTKTIVATCASPATLTADTTKNHNVVLGIVVDKPVLNFYLRQFDRLIDTFTDGYMKSLLDVADIFDPTPTPTSSSKLPPNVTVDLRHPTAVMPITSPYEESYLQNLPTITSSGVSVSTKYVESESDLTRIISIAIADISIENCTASEHHFGIDISLSSRPHFFGLALTIEDPIFVDLTKESLRYLTSVFKDNFFVSSGSESVPEEESVSILISSITAAVKNLDPNVPEMVMVADKPTIALHTSIEGNKKIEVSLGSVSCVVDEDQPSPEGIVFTSACEHPIEDIRLPEAVSTPPKEESAADAMIRQLVSQGGSQPLDQSPTWVQPQQREPSTSADGHSLSQFKDEPSPAPLTPDNQFLLISEASVTITIPTSSPTTLIDGTVTNINILVSDQVIDVIYSLGGLLDSIPASGSGSGRGLALDVGFAKSQISIANAASVVVTDQRVSFVNESSLEGGAERILTWTCDTACASTLVDGHSSVLLLQTDTSGKEITIKNIVKDNLESIDVKANLGSISFVVVSSIINEISRLFWYGQRGFVPSQNSSKPVVSLQLAVTSPTFLLPVSLECSSQFVLLSLTKCDITFVEEVLTVNLDEFSVTCENESVLPQLSTTIQLDCRTSIISSNLPCIEISLTPQTLAILKAILARNVSQVCLGNPTADAVDQDEGSTHPQHLIKCEGLTLIILDKIVDENDTIATIAAKGLSLEDNKGIIETFSIEPDILHCKEETNTFLTVGVTDGNIEAELNPITISVTPSLLNSLVGWLDSASIHAEDRFLTESQVSESPSSAHNEVVSGKPVFNISVLVQGLSLSLFHFGNVLLTSIIGVSRANVNSAFTNGTLTLGVIQVFNDSGDEIVGLATPDRDNFISVDYRQVVSSKGYVHDLSVVVHSIKVVFTAVLAKKIHTALQGDIRTKLAETRQKLKQEAKSAATSKFQLNVRVEHPIVLIPEIGTDSGIRLDLGLLLLSSNSSTKSDDTDLFSATLKDCLIFSFSEMILKDPINVDASIKKLLIERNHVSLDIAAQVSPIDLSLDKKQWNRILQVVSSNLLGITETEDVEYNASDGDDCDKLSVSRMASEETKRTRPFTTRRSTKIIDISINAMLPSFTVTTPTEGNRSNVLCQFSNGSLVMNNSSSEKVANKLTLSFGKVKIAELLEVVDNQFEMCSESDFLQHTFTGNMSATFKPDYILRILDTVVVPVRYLMLGKPPIQSQKVTTITVTDNLTLSEDLHLSSTNILHVTSSEFNAVTLKANGCSIYLHSKGCIRIDEGILFTIQQAEIVLWKSSNIANYVNLGGPNSGFLADPVRNKIVCEKLRKKEKMKGSPAKSNISLSKGSLTPVEKKWVPESPTQAPCPSTPSETLAESLRRAPLESPMASPIRSLEGSISGIRGNLPSGTFHLTAPAVPQSKVVKVTVKTNIKIIITDDTEYLEPNLGEYDLQEQRALVITLRGVAADVNSRFDIRSGDRNNTLSTVCISACEVTRRTYDSQGELPVETSLMQRTRCDAYYREDSRSPTAVEVLAGSVSVRVAISDVLFLAKILKKVTAVRYDSVLTSSTKPLQQDTDNNNNNNKESSGLTIECRIPGISICFIDDVGEVHLPLFESRTRDVKAMIAVESPEDDKDPDYRARLSFCMGVSHYNQVKCEFETVVEEGPIGIDVQQSPAFGTSMSQLRLVLTGAAGLKIVISPVLINTIRSVHEKFQSQPQFPTAGSQNIGSSDIDGTIEHSRLSKYPTKIENSLPFPVSCSFSGQKGDIVVPTLGTQSMFGCVMIDIENPIDKARHRVDTSVLGFRPLSSGVFVSTKLRGGVKITSILTAVMITNTLHVEVAVKLLAANEQLEFQLPRYGCLSVVTGMIDRRLMVENSIPKLPVSEIVHNARQRGGSVEIPVMDSSGDTSSYFVIQATKSQSQTHIRICPSFAVTNLTGAQLQMGFYTHPDNCCIMSASAKPDETIQLSSLDPTRNLFMSMSLQQQGGEQLTLPDGQPFQIRGVKSASDRLLLTPLIDKSITPVWLDVTFSKASGRREMQITCRYWVVNHTQFNILLCHKDGTNQTTSTMVPGLAESPVLISPELETDLVVKLRICGDPKDACSDDLLLHHLGAEGIAVIGTVLIKYRTSWSNGAQGYRTRVIELLPYRIFFNNLDHTLYLHSANITTPGDPITYSFETDLPPGVPIRINTHSSHVSFSMNDTDPDTKKACCMEIGQGTECKLVMRIKCPKEGDFAYMSCTVRCEGTQYVTMTKVSPPFMIVNRTPLKLEMWQTGFSDETISTEPRKTSAFGWDNVMSERTVQIRVLGKTSNSFSLYEVEALSESVLSLPVMDIFCTIAPMKHDDVIQVTFHTDPLLENSVLRLRDSVGRLSILNIKLDIKDISISLVRDKEIACLTLQGLFVQIHSGFGQEMLQVTLQGFQLDDMSEQHPLFPVPLCPIDPPPASQPFFRLSTLRRLNYSDLIDFQHISVWIDAVSVNIGDHFLWQLLELNREAGIAHRRAPCHSLSNDDHKERALAGKDQKGLGSRRIHFDVMELGSIVLSVTVDRLIEGRDPYRDALGLGLLSLALPSVKDCHLALSGVVIRNGRDTVGMLLKRSCDNYTQQIEASRNFIGFIGRIPVFGNPLGLFTNISTGVKDFFILPAIGLTRSPFDFGSGIVKGTGSLVGKSFGGVFGTVAGLTKGSARIVESVADDEWRTKRSHLTKTSPHALESTVKGVFDGIVGIVRDPVIGTMQGGAVGGIVGVGKGILGALAKPISGVLHDVSDTAALLERMLLAKASPLRIRPPKYFASESEGQTAGVRWQEVYENERWYAGIGWSNKLLPAVDYPPWSTKDGSPATEKDRIQLRKGHVWTGPWHVDISNSKEGWMYAVNFTSSFHVHHHELDFVRRKRWMRAYQLASEAPIDLTTASDQSTKSKTMRSGFIALEQRVSSKPAVAKAISRHVAATSMKSVLSRNAGHTTVIETTENERHIPGSGWSGELDVMDCWHWSNKNGTSQRKPRDNITPPKGMCWFSDWETDGGDQLGWYYSTHWDGSFAAESSATSCVRRRHWRRVAREL